VSITHRRARPDTALDDAGSSRPTATLLVVAVMVALVQLDSTIVTVAAPAAGADLGASLTGLQWLVNGYLIALGLSVVPAGLCGDRIGHRRVFLVGALVFTVASAGCALAPATPALIAGRLVQGAGGGLVLAGALGIVRHSVSGRQLAPALGAITGISALAVAMGPLLGGALVDVWGWRAVFAANVPVGLVAVAAGAGVLARGRAAATSLTPLNDLAEIARNRAVRTGGGLLFCHGLALFGLVFFLNVQMQRSAGLSPTDTGVRLLPLTVMIAVGAPVGGQLVRLFGVVRPLMVGLVLASGSFLMLAAVPLEARYLPVAACLAVIGVGMAWLQVAASQLVLGSPDERLAGVAGGAQSAISLLGAAAGTVLLSGVLGAVVRAGLPGRLADQGLSPGAAARVIDAGSDVAQGFTPLPAGTPPRIAESIAAASDATFLQGVDAVLLTCAAALALVGLLAAVSLRPGGRPAGAHRHRRRSRRRGHAGCPGHR
jgi:predicted MFS family arabinose efflux permease